MLHTVKEWPSTYEETFLGTRRIQFRKYDRKYQADDVLEICEYDPQTGLFTGRSCVKRIVSVQESMHLPPGIVALVIEHMDVEQQAAAFGERYTAELTSEGIRAIQRAEPIVRDELFSNEPALDARSMGF